MTLASKPCVLCGTAEVTPRFEKFGYQVVRCDSCRLVYLDHSMTPEDYRTFYSEEYFSGGDDRRGYADYVGDRAPIRKSFEVKLDAIERLRPPGAVLDVGCAAGFFLEEAANRGWEVYGQEVSEFAGAVAAETFPGRVFVGPLEEIELADGSLDLVTLWDVVEHLDDPVGALRRVRGLLKPDGLLALCTVRIDSWLARLQGSTSRIYNPPQHLYYYSADSLARIVSSAGFDILERRADSKALSFEYFSYVVSHFNPNPITRWVREVARGSSWAKRTIHLPLVDNQVVIARAGDPGAGAAFASSDSTAEGLTA